MKRLVSLILAVSMVLSMFTMAFAGSGLKDVAGTKYEAAVEALVELGVVTGYPDETFQPNNVVTRAELAKLLVVAYGLEPAAEASKGVTPFSDIASNHWASGYINVSADYKFVNGYPEGTFKGDATVTYAEAITMCLRVLGYANEIDSKGTWPTNYIAKAQDLGLMEGIEFSSYNDGAKRGDIALLIWNMLTTDMWVVTSESEGDGLQSSPSKKMLNVKFKDYAYEDEAIFEGFSIEEDTKNETAKVVVTIDDEEYDYAENDFYTFVPGTEVEVLINKKDKTLLTMVATDKDKLVDGEKDVIDDDYSELRDEEYDYAYLRAVKKDIADATILYTISMYIDEVEAKKDYATLDFGVSKEKCNFDDLDYLLFLKDGERIKFSEAVKAGDIAAGDILTGVMVFDYTTENVELFYVIGGSEVEGEFKRYEEVDYENSDLTFEQLTLDKKEYVVDVAATFVEDPDEEDRDVLVLAEEAEQAMKGEEVVVYLDGFFGKVVRIHFDGKIDAGNDTETTVQFYAIGDGDVDRNSDKRYFYDFVNENGEADELLVKKNSELEADAKSEYVNGDELTGSYVVVTLNEDDEIVDMQYIVDSGKFALPLDKVVYGDEADKEYYDFIELDSDDYDKDTAWFMDGSTKTIKATDDTVLVRVVVDSDEDEITVEFETGLDAIEKEMKTTQDVIAIYDAAATRMRAKYLVVITDGSDNSDYEVAIVDDVKAGSGVYVGDTVIKLADENKEVVDTLLVRDSEEDDYNNHELVVYTVTTKVVNKEEKRTFNYKAGLTTEELSMSYDHKVVTKVDGGSFFIVGSTTEYDLADYEDETEDTLFVIVNVSETEDEGQYEVDTFGTTDFSGLKLRNYDRLLKSTEDDVVFVIRGMEKVEEAGN